MRRFRLAVSDQEDCFVEKSLDNILASLQKLIGLHRQLLDACRAERTALVAADVRQIQDATLIKQGVVEAIRQAEAARIGHVAELAMSWKRPARELSLPNLIIALQGREPAFAEQLRSALNTITILIQRITVQNDDNRQLVERAMVNVDEMKRNVLGEAVPRSNTYTSQGQRSGVTGGARLFTHEA